MAANLSNGSTANPTPADNRPYGVEDASYQAAGGYEGIQKLVDAFYRYMDELPQAQGIRQMHDQDLSETKQKLTYFLSGWLGGPRLYRETYGPIIIPKAHSHLAIGARERDAWMLCMEKAVADQDFAEDFKAYLLRQLFVPAEFTRKHCEKIQSGQMQE